MSASSPSSAFVGYVSRRASGHSRHVRHAGQASLMRSDLERPISGEDSVDHQHPFFDGWFMRLTDLTTGFTMSVVLGLYWSVFRRSWSQRLRSRRKKGTSSRQEHYLCISARDPTLNQTEALHSAHLFPRPERTTLDFGEAPLSMSSPDIPLHESPKWAGPITGSGSMMYDSEEHGTIELDSSKVACHLHGLGENQQPWTLDLEAPLIPQPDRWVPEGWVGKFGRFGVLPCRYMILTTASEARYSLQAPGGLAPGEVQGRLEAAPNFNVEGNAQLHVEANYGECFPDGWIYAQGHGRGDSEGVRLVLTGGRFEIGPVKPITWILCLELPGMEPIHFRTTDLDRCEVKKLSFEHKVVDVEFRRRRWVPRRGQRQTSVGLCLTAPESSFGQNGGVYVPTPLGFDRAPGALESFAASASIEVKHHDEEASSFFKLDDIVLEFGGSFQQQNL